MEFIFGIFITVLSIISWIAWSIILGIVFFLAVAIPWCVWEGFMWLTFNNIINAIAKIPTFIGWLIGFIVALPFAIPGIVISIWCYIQTIIMGILVLNGDPTSTYAQNYLKIVEDWEFSTPGCMFVARYFYNNMQWLWGGASIFRGYFFWQNGVWMDIGNELSVPFTILKTFLLAIPILLMFVLPLLPVLWSITRPFVGAASCLPAVSENGDGRDD